MNTLKTSITLPIVLSIIFTGSALGQSAGSRDADGTTTVNAAKTPIVEPMQSSTWGIGTKPTDKKDEPARKPFQMRAAINVGIGSGGAAGFLPIPVGKRLVIENVSAVGRYPEGLRMELKFYTYFDNGDGVGDIADITFHRIVLTDQGTFQGTAVSSANQSHKDR